MQKIFDEHCTCSCSELDGIYYGQWRKESKIDEVSQVKVKMCAQVTLESGEKW